MQSETLLKNGQVDLKKNTASKSSVKRKSNSSKVLRRGNSTSKSGSSRNETAASVQRMLRQEYSRATSLLAAVTVDTGDLGVSEGHSAMVGPSVTVNTVNTHVPRSTAVGSLTQRNNSKPSRALKRQPSRGNVYGPTDQRSVMAGHSNSNSNNDNSLPSSGTIFRSPNIGRSESSSRQLPEKLTQMSHGHKGTSISGSAVVKRGATVFTPRSLGTSTTYVVDSAVTASDSNKNEPPGSGLSDSCTHLSRGSANSNTNVSSSAGNSNAHMKSSKCVSDISGLISRSKNKGSLGTCGSVGASSYVRLSFSRKDISYLIGEQYDESLVDLVNEIDYN